MPLSIRRLLASTPFWLPAVLMIGVAINQQRLARYEFLSPWSGGGFGMFSSTDAPNNRHLHAFIQNEGIRREVLIPAALRESALRATTHPTHRRLESLAMQLANLESGSRVRWRKIELQVWAAGYANDSLAPRAKLLKKETFSLDDE